MRSKKVIHLFATAIAVVLLLLVWAYKLPPFYTFSLGFDDFNFAFNTKKPSQDVVFVAIDEPSVNALGRWPWDRSVLAQGLEHLSQANVVLLDMVFSEPTNAKSDEDLSFAIEDLTTVCGFFLRHKATQSFDRYDLVDSSIPPMDSPNFTFRSGAHVEGNIDGIFDACTRHAAFSTFSENDSIFRFYPLGFVYDKALYPSLGLSGLSVGLQEQKIFNESLPIDYTIQQGGDDSVYLNMKYIQVDERGFTRLNYYERSSYQTVSFLKLFNKSIDENFFKDKIVILGITEAGVEDVRPTPIGLIPGPILHYTFISNYLQGDLLVHKISWVYTAVALFVLLVLAMIFWVKKVLYRAMAYLLAAVTFIVAAKLLYVYANIWLETFYALLILVVVVVVNEIISFTTQEKESKFIQNAFSSYLSPMLLDKLKEHPELLKLGGQTKEMTIFFSDIRSFTNISESMTPQSLVQLLNRYFTPMAHIVRDNEGMLDKYIGDAVMAFYNAPLDVDDHAKKACRSALQMIEHLEVLNKEFAKEGLPAIDIGIGLNTADVIVGNMGSDDRFNYTVIGDGVNLASRVEGLNKNYHTKILITEFTYEKLDSTFLTRPLEAVQVKGKNQAVMLYELLINSDENQKMVAMYNDAHALFSKHEFTQSMQAFKEVSKTFDDLVSELFYEKSAMYAQKQANNEPIEAVKFTSK